MAMPVQKVLLLPSSRIAGEKQITIPRQYIDATTTGKANYYKNAWRPLPDSEGQAEVYGLDHVLDL